VGGDYGVVVPTQAAEPQGLNIGRVQLPSFDQLPRAANGSPTARGLFGERDNLGLVNLLTPERIAAATRLVRRGAVFALNAEIRAFDPPLYGRERAEHRIIRTPDDPDLDDALDRFNPQASSQWDSLAHAPGVDGRWYNGVSFEEITAAGRNTIDHWARRGLAGRGVLLDLERLMLDENREYDPFTSVSVSVDQLERCRAAAGVEYRTGDILLLHTGFAARYQGLPATRREKLADWGRFEAIGIEHSEKMVRYLWDSHIFALATDAPAVEVWPPDRSPEAAPYGYLHQVLIPELGMALGELWWLDDIARDCREDGVYEMLVTSAPLHVAGGISSPPNALALK
jgi:kynurenine formamidase